MCVEPFALYIDLYVVSCSAPRENGQPCIMLHCTDTLNTESAARKCLHFKVCFCRYWMHDSVIQAHSLSPREVLLHAIAQQEQSEERCERPVDEEGLLAAGQAVCAQAIALVGFESRNFLLRNLERRFLSATDRTLPVFRQVLQSAAAHVSPLFLLDQNAGVVLLHPRSAVAPCLRAGNHNLWNAARATHVSFLNPW